MWNDTISYLRYSCFFAYFPDAELDRVLETVSHSERQLPNVTLLGDTSGDGGGYQADSERSNGG